MPADRGLDENADLLRRIAGGDRDAFAALYDAFAPRLLGMLVRRFGDRTEAEDVLQDCFWHVWRRAEQFDPQRGGVWVWLLQIARSRAIDRFRKRPPASHLAEPAAEVADATDAATPVLAAETARRTRDALLRLDEAQREAIEMSFYTGLTHEQIAARTRRPLGTIKSHIRRGMSRLRVLLSGAPEMVGE